MNYTGLGKCSNSICGLVVPLGNGHEVGRSSVNACVGHPNQDGVRCYGSGKPPAETIKKLPEVYHWVSFYGNLDRYGIMRSRFVLRDGQAVGYDETSKFHSTCFPPTLTEADAINRDTVRPVHPENMPVLYVTRFVQEEHYSVDRLTVWAPGHKPEESWHRRRTFLSGLDFRTAGRMANNANRNVV